MHGSFASVGKAGRMQPAPAVPCEQVNSRTEHIFQHPVLPLASKL